MRCVIICSRKISSFSGNWYILKFGTLQKSDWSPISDLRIGLNVPGEVTTDTEEEVRVKTS